MFGLAAMQKTEQEEAEQSASSNMSTKAKPDEKKASAPQEMPKSSQFTLYGVQLGDERSYGLDLATDAELEAIKNAKILNASLVELGFFAAEQPASKKEVQKTQSIQLRL